VRICVVGLGRVGLPTVARAAEAGHDVTGVDRDPAALIRARGAHPTEPGLTEVVSAAVSSGRLAFATVPVRADVYVVCVGTPLAEGARADLSALDAALASIGAVAPPGALLVIESTVPVGTADRAAAALPGLRVAAAPERVWPGRALRELAENPRVVGGVDEESAVAAAAFFATLGAGDIDRTDARTAELVKLCENAARDVEIALANTLAAVSRAHGLDPHAVRALVNRHPRVALREPGIGVGGHCLPVDPWFLVEGAPAHTALLRAARGVNDGAPGAWAARIAARAGGRPIGLLGLGYKADSDDLRHAPAVEIALRLSASADVVVADPYHDAVDGIALAPLEVAAARPVVALLVAHAAYRVVRLRPDQIGIDACGGWR
jgi:UDP-N-acetyl-D-mannosaminuronic acid dehydrogenase